MNGALTRLSNHSFRKQTNFPSLVYKFEILKGISRLRDEESLCLLCQGLVPRIMSLIHGSDVAPPDNYADFAAKVHKIAINLDINYGYQHVLGPTGMNNKSSPPRDQQTGSCVTYGRSGCAMEIDAMGPCCYNCGQFGHITNKCTKPKREKGTCFECRK